jgi:hypothetical protein
VPQRIIGAVALAVLGVAVWFSIVLARADAYFRQATPESVQRAVEIAPRNTEYLALRALQLDYDGADSTAVGSDQFDFETVVMHELGHALGLGHNPDGSSVMYCSLAPAAARRSLTVTDLNIPDPGTGADGLHVFIPLPPGTPYEAGLIFCQLRATS